MKKIIFALVAITSLGLNLVNAQTPVKRYNATYASGGTYTPLSGATDAGLTANWNDEVSTNITLPFPFKYQNVPINTVAISTFGDLILNNTPNQYKAAGHIYGIHADYRSEGRGKVYYSTTGTTGNRIFKVEFKNVGFNDPSTTDTANFQIWLYENDNAIEYRAGYCNVPATMFANDFMDIINGKIPVHCGLIGNPGDSLATGTTNAFFHATKRTGTTFSDTAIALNAAEMVPDSTTVINALLYGTFPTDGSVIRFVPISSTTSIAKIDFDMASVYPNPSKDGVYQLSLKEAPKTGASLTIYDISGKAVLTQELRQSSCNLDLSIYANGQYFGKIINGNRIGSFKLIKE